jgi:radical SAM protein with 4Fe4S-binding SPASM domain
MTMNSPLRHLGSIVWKRRPIHLTFFVTRKCDMRCPFCFYIRGSEKREADDAELSLDEIRKISGSLGTLLWLAFSGGEIFLRDDLVEMSRLFYDRNKPAIMLYPTNGQRPQRIREATEEILKSCRRSVVVVKLSLDGLYGDHDALRGKRGSFEKTMETYRLLGELLASYPHFELGINTVLCSENRDRMEGMVEFVSGLEHIRTHTISLVRGDLLDESYKNVDASSYERAIGRLEKDLKNGSRRLYRFKGARLKAAQDSLQRRLIHRTLLEKKRLTSCYAGRLNLVLTETGEVYPCEMLSESFGNVRNYDYDLKRIVRSERAAAITRSIRDGRCHCTHECYFMTNILFNPRWYPALIREYLRR